MSLSLRNRTSQWCAGILILLSLYAPMHVIASEASVLRAQIKTRNQQIEQIEQEIRELGEDISTTSQQRVTLENKLQRIEQERQHLLKELELTETKIEKTSLTISNLDEEISDKEQRIELQKSSIADSVRDMKYYDDYSLLELVLTRETFSEAWRAIDNLITLQGASRRHIRQLQGLQTTLRQDISEKEDQKGELESLKEEIESQKEIVELNKNEQAELVSLTKNKEQNYRVLLQQMEAQREAFESEIRQYESQLEFLSNPDALPERGSSPLSWPLDHIVVTALFGSRVGPHRTRANGHSGTDFRARTPQKLYAMADGVVMGTGNTDVACKGVSFGKWVTVEHDNGLVSTSAHLSLVNVKPGQRVTRGQVIAYTGNTGFSTAPHLHISVYAGRDANGENPVDVGSKPSLSCSGAISTQPTAPYDAYLDPLDYLPKPLTLDMFKHPANFYDYQ